MSNNKTTPKDAEILHGNKYDLCNFIELAEESCHTNITSFLIEIYRENGKFKTLNTRETTINVCIDKKKKLVYFNKQDEKGILGLNERARRNIYDSLHNFEYKGYHFQK